MTITDCYKVIPEGPRYQIYRILAYNVETREPAQAELMKEYLPYASRDLALRKRAWLESELKRLSKYGFTHYEGVY